MRKVGKLHAAFGWSPGMAEKTFGLWANAAGHLAATDHACPQRIKDDWLIIYCVRGTGVFRQGDTAFRIEAGQVFMAFPDLVHSYWSDPEIGWDIWWVHFQGDLIPRLSGLAGFAVDNSVLNVGQNKRLVKHFSSLCETLKAKEIHAGIDAAGEIMNILLEIHRSSGPLQRENSKSSHPPLSDARTLDEMAAQAGMSKFHFARTFHETVGVTPWRYITSRKISRAKEMLADTDMPVKAIAFELGFNDPNYFSRLFKKETGMSAREFRKRNTQHYS